MLEEVEQLKIYSQHRQTASTFEAVDKTIFLIDTYENEKEINNLTTLVAVAARILGYPGIMSEQSKRGATKYLVDLEKLSDFRIKRKEFPIGQLTSNEGITCLQTDFNGSRVRVVTIPFSTSLLDSKNEIKAKYDEGIALENKLT